MIRRITYSVCVGQYMGVCRFVTFGAHSVRLAIQISDKQCM